jgi:hypothetical protein
MHPETDRHALLGSAAPTAPLQQVRHQGLAGLEYLLRPFKEIHRQTQIPPQLVGDNVERGLEDPRDRRDRPAFLSQPLDLRPECGKVAHHRHAALDERQVVAVRGRTARRTDLRRDPRQPDIVQKSHRVGRQGLILIRLHVGVVFRRLPILKTRILWNMQARNAVILQPDRLRQARPHIHHVGHDRIPVEVRGALARRLECDPVIVRDLLACQAGVFGGELGDKRRIGIMSVCPSASRSCSV